ncbi:MAG TPA: helix-turn-helix transcriptional regulator [Candidatus Levybacteria bacterium]|nr:helix-turn-helix transcriptional regulator [Candidatus Levybacteria bacterium]
MSHNVSNNVSDYRNKNKVTQEELGKAVGVTRQTIIAIEKGNYTPSVLLALKIAKYFNTMVEKLFTIGR